MTQLRPPRVDQSRPGQHRAGLTALAGATFVYVTAETLPIGLVPQLSAGLHVRPGTVGLLVTVYAAVAGLSAVPLTAALEHCSRRQVVVGCVAVLALSQFVIAVAPGYPVVMAARIVCALTHGVFWSMLAPVAARLVAPGQGGRATALVFTGNSVALVLGVPLGTALGHLIGWRPTMAALGVVAVLSAVALRRALPTLPAPSLPPPGPRRPLRPWRPPRSRTLTRQPPRPPGRHPGRAAQRPAAGHLRGHRAGRNRSLHGLHLHHRAGPPTRAWRAWPCRRCCSATARPACRYLLSAGPPTGAPCRRRGVRPGVVAALIGCTWPALGRGHRRRRVVWAAFTALPVPAGAVLRSRHARPTPPRPSSSSVPDRIAAAPGRPLLVDAGELSALCVTGAALAAAACWSCWPPAARSRRRRPGPAQYRAGRIAGLFSA